MAKNNKIQVFDEINFTRTMFDRIHHLNEVYETSNNQDISYGTPIPENDQYFIELKTNIQKFVGSIKTDENSLVVYPNDGDAIFSGEITSMNNLKFQFRYNDQSGGLYIWADSVLLTKDTADKLGKLVVLKEQWSTYWDEHISDYQ